MKLHACTLLPHCGRRPMVAKSDMPRPPSRRMGLKAADRAPRTGSNAKSRLNF